MPTSGSATILGLNPKDAKRSVGVVPERLGLFDNLTGQRQRKRPKRGSSFWPSWQVWQVIDPRLLSGGGYRRRYAPGKRRVRLDPERSVRCDGLEFQIEATAGWEPELPRIAAIQATQLYRPLGSAPNLPSQRRGPPREAVDGNVASKVKSSEIKEQAPAELTAGANSPTA